MMIKFNLTVTFMLDVTLTPGLLFAESGGRIFYLDTCQRSRIKIHDSRTRTTVLFHEHGQVRTRFFIDSIGRLYMIKRRATAIYLLEGVELISSPIQWASSSVIVSTSRSIRSNREKLFSGEVWPPPDGLASLCWCSVRVG
jgi:hypothetical protein